MTSLLGRMLRCLGQHLWLWPLLAAVLFLLTAWYSQHALQRTSRSLTRSQLQTLLDTERKALLHWLGEQQANVRLIAADSQFLAGVQDLLARPDLAEITAARLAETPEVQALRDTYKAVPANLGYPDFLVLDPSFRVIAGSYPELLNQRVPPDSSQQFARVFYGQSWVTPPTASRILLPDGQGSVRAGLPTMFVLAPVTDAQGNILAALACRMDPRQEFSEIMSLSRFGETGEIYAFNQAGQLLSKSRFESELKALALIQDSPEASSILQLTLKDPGVDLRHQPRRHPRESWPLTRLVQAATQGQSGVDIVGHRDYRGVPVVAAWTWIPEYQLGLAAQIDQEEVRRPFEILRRTAHVTLTVLTLSALGLFGLTAVVRSQQRQLQQAAIAARQLGQYVLDDEIGQGSNGRVFRARHAHLRRPVAVKLLDAEQTTPSTIARFEREVQATCRLSHPNTIVVYDYGRTPEGVFYYAMEHLEGLTLDQLVQRFGPLPDGRVVWLLRQVCGSLAEAHAHGLIHRDIKPANLFLTQRGGLADVVKVLDFGLVKAIDAQSGLGRTLGRSLVGTPLFVPPECIETPNQITAQSDLYSLGAVGYYLLTGEPVFPASDLADVLLGHTQRTPEPPSQRRGTPVEPALEALILRCLEKIPALRPQGALELEQILARCSSSNDWSQTQANQWWSEHLSAPQPPQPTT